VHQGYIEPHAVVADATQEDKAVVWCSSQGHFRVQSQTAAMLGWQPSQIKVLPAEIGGGFGGKTTIYLVSHRPLRRARRLERQRFAQPSRR
jgi:CO/xanthine dehydrogenase Mo-binding subunit